MSDTIDVSVERLLSGSKVPVVVNCPPAHVLPHCSESGTAPQERGTALHLYVEMCSTDGWAQDRALEEIGRLWPEHLEECKEIDLDTIKDIVEFAAPEVAMAYSTARGGRILGQSIARDYRGKGAKPDEICLTIDALIHGDGFVHVIDYKSGFSDLGPLLENGQMFLAAVTAADAYNVDRAIMTIIDLNTMKRDTSEVSLFGLAAYRDRLAVMERGVQAATKRVAEGRAPDVTEGRWCRNCDAYNACPAKKSLAIELASGADSFGLSLNREQMAEAWVKVGLARDMLNKIDKAIRAEAAREPIPLPNGKFIGQVHKKGNEKLDGDIVYAVVEEFHGQEVAADAVKFTATKVGLKNALKSHGYEKPGPAQKAILKEVANRGGSKRTPSTKIEEYTVRKV